MSLSLYLVAGIGLLCGQTAESLFRLSDSLQVSEIVSEVPDIADELGHGGPAVENSHMALRMPFDDSGSIDVYSKNARGMELLKYMWNTTPAQQDTLYAGCDGYVVDGTLGLGGIALKDGDSIVRLEAAGGRTARVGDTKKGSFAELVAHRVPYAGDYVDIMIRIDVMHKSRSATVTATELSGKKVVFVTGVNYHRGQKVLCGEEYISVWGPHPGAERPFAIGAGLLYSLKDFPMREKTDDQILVFSKPSAKVRTTIVSASVKEAELNSAKRFETYMTK